MISIKITDEALKDLFLREGHKIRPSVVAKGIPDEATIVSSHVVGPGILEMVWDLHDGIEKIIPAHIEIMPDMVIVEQIHQAGALGSVV